MDALKYKQKAAKYHHRLHRQQVLLRRLARAMVSLGFGDIVNSIIRESRYDRHV